jgi:hypothetical protein
MSFYELLLQSIEKLASVRIEFYDSDSLLVHKNRWTDIIHLDSVNQLFMYTFPCVGDKGFGPLCCLETVPFYL